MKTKTPKPAFVPRGYLKVSQLVLIVLSVVLATLLVVSVVVKPGSRAAQSLVTSSVFDHSMIFTTLGTMGGPIASPDRSQPANLLWNDDQAILIDAGDGAAEQLAKAGVPLPAVSAVVLTHLHFDHVGGLYAIIGMRIQQRVGGELMIYGPIGTAEMVAGLVAAQSVTEAELTAETPAAAGALARSTVAVTEVNDGSTFAVGAVTVTAVSNSHYPFADGSKEAAEYQSLSYRFDTPDRSIVFTGDTGPSANVEQLAIGADLLVTEIIDPAAELQKVTESRPDLPVVVYPLIQQHFEQEHLTAEQVGLLAQRAAVKAVVITHNALDSDGIRAALSTIAAHFAGPVAVANDLDNY